MFDLKILIILLLYFIGSLCIVRFVTYAKKFSLFIINFLFLGLILYRLNMLSSFPLYDLEYDNLARKYIILQLVLPQITLFIIIVSIFFLEFVLYKMKKLHLLI